MKNETDNHSDKAQKLRYSIDIFDVDTMLTDHTCPEKTQYYVEPEQLMRILNVGHKRHVFRPEKSLLYMSSENDRTVYVYSVPASTRKITMAFGEKERKFNISLPPVIYVISTKGEYRDVKLDEIYAFCHSGRGLKPSTMLYEMPLPNFSANRMCFGGIDRSIEGGVLESVEKAVFGTPFNTHYSTVGKEKIPFEKYHKKCRGKAALSTITQSDRAEKIIGFFFD